MNNSSESGLIKILHFYSLKSLFASSFHSLTFLISILNGVRRIRALKYRVDNTDEQSKFIYSTQCIGGYRLYNIGVIYRLEHFSFVRISWYNYTTFCPVAINTYRTAGIVWLYIFQIPSGGGTIIVLCTKMCFFFLLGKHIFG